MNAVGKGPRLSPDEKKAVDEVWSTIEKEAVSVLTLQLSDLLPEELAAPRKYLKKATILVLYSATHALATKSMAVSFQSGRKEYAGAGSRAGSYRPPPPPPYSSHQVSYALYERVRSLFSSQIVERCVALEKMHKAMEGERKTKLNRVAGLKLVTEFARVWNASLVFGEYIRRIFAHLDKVFAINKDKPNIMTMCLVEIFKELYKDQGSIIVSVSMALVGLINEARLKQARGDDGVSADLDLAQFALDFFRAAGVIERWSKPNLHRPTKGKGNGKEKDEDKGEDKGEEKDKEDGQQNDGVEGAGKKGIRTTSSIGNSILEQANEQLLQHMAKIDDVSWEAAHAKDAETKAALALNTVKKFRIGKGLQDIGVDHYLFVKDFFIRFKAESKATLKEVAHQLHKSSGLGREYIRLAYKCMRWEEEILCEMMPAGFRVDVLGEVKKILLTDMAETVLQDEGIFEDAGVFDLPASTMPDLVTTYSLPRRLPPQQRPFLDSFPLCASLVLRTPAASGLCFKLYSSIEDAPGSADCIRKIGAAFASHILFKNDSLVEQRRALVKRLGDARRQEIPTRHVDFVDGLVQLLFESREIANTTFAGHIVFHDAARDAFGRIMNRKFEAAVDVGEQDFKVEF